MNSAWWRLKPVISRLHYWHQKEQFLLDVDCYQGWVMFLPDQGRFAYEIGQEAGEAGMGDLVVCPPGVAFRRKTITPLSFHFIEFFWQDEGNVITSHEGLPSGKLTAQDTDRLSSTCRHLRSLVQHQDPLSRHWKNQLLYDLFCLHWIEAHTTPESQQQKAEDPLMQRAGLYLQQHAHMPLSLKALASTLRLSPVQLTRRFRAAFGMSPREYLTSLRLQKIRTLLLETDLTLEEIAQRCGYENGFYLSRVFTKKMQISPSRFRKAYRV